MYIPMAKIVAVSTYVLPYNPTCTSRLRVNRL